MRIMNLPAAEVLARASQRGYARHEIEPCIHRRLPEGRWIVDVESPFYPHETRRQPGVAVGVSCLPGKHLASLLSWLGVREDGAGCKCKGRAAEMDRKGCDWCSENIDTIVGWLREEAGRRGLPFLDAAARLLVMEAIRRARKEAKAAMDKSNG